MGARSGDGALLAARLRRIVPTSSPVAFDDGLGRVSRVRACRDADFEAQDATSDGFDPPSEQATPPVG